MKQEINNDKLHVNKSYNKHLKILDFMLPVEHFLFLSILIIVLLLSIISAINQLI
jgi:hypothetical protein